MADVRAGAIAKWGAVHGVIDSAFVLRDMSLANMDEARFREALDPKVRGTAAALWTFRGDKLDWFALFSSSISFTAGPGQANYAAASTGQDALGHCWNAVGAWPVRILNWGYWGSVGAVASDVYRRRASALGVGSIEEADGIAAFHAALEGTHTQLMVAKTLGAGPAKREAAPPVDTAEEQDAVAYVRRVVSEVLQLTADDLDDERPFEEYGVDSLVSLSIVTQLEADLGPLAKTLLFEHPTIGLLARFVAANYAERLKKPTSEAPAVLFPIRETGSAPRTFWVHSVVGEMNWAVRLAHHMGPEWPVFGFKAAALEVERPAFSRLEEMAAAYVKAMRAAQPAGPYILGGFSFGGSVAFEMARQLGEAGERVAWLVLLDAYAPGSRALDSLARLSWDGFLPQVIANLLVHQWKGTEFLAADALPKDDFEAQIRIAARHVRSACAIPQSEADIARIMKNSARAADFHAELQQNYVARPCPAVDRAILVRNRYGFVGPDNALGLPRTAVDDAAPDHGWSQWLPQTPLIVEADADHFSLGLEPAIEVVGRRIAQLIGGRDASAAQQRVFDVVKGHVLRVLPDLRAEAITLDARLKDLGANSLDRIEVATCAMEELDINVPRTRLAGVDSLGGLVDALLGSLPGNGKG
jgi:thioesterase domain-containing protein/acyl carrier protein